LDSRFLIGRCRAGSREVPKLTAKGAKDAKKTTGRFEKSKTGVFNRGSAEGAELNYISRIN
jgi:hypothetical protein